MRRPCDLCQQSPVAFPYCCYFDATTQKLRGLCFLGFSRNLHKFLHNEMVFSVFPWPSKYCLSTSVTKAPPKRGDAWLTRPCLVSLQTPFRLNLRIWDIYIFEGERILTAMSYTILKLHKSKETYDLKCFIKSRLILILTSLASLDLMLCFSFFFFLNH